MWATASLLPEAACGDVGSWPRKGREGKGEPLWAGTETFPTECFIRLNGGLQVGLKVGRHSGWASLRSL